MKIYKAHWQEISKGILASVLFLVPLFFWPGFTQNFELPKALLFRSLILIALSFNTIKLLKTKHPLIKIILALTALLTIATIISPARIQSFFGTQERTQGLIQWFYYLGFFFLLLANLNKKHLQELISVFLISSGIVAGYAIFQNYGYDPFFKHYDTAFLLGRAFSTLGNPDFLGQFISLAIPLSISRIRKNKLLYPLLTIILFLALFYSQSRAPIAGLLVAGSIYLLHLIIKKKAFKLVATTIAATTVILLTLFFTTNLLERFTPNSTNFNSISSRITIAKASTKIISQNPLFGIGPENFGSQSKEYLSPQFHVDELSMNTTTDRAHNDLLEIGIATGIPGIITWIILIFYLIKGFFRSTEKTHQALYLASLTYIFQNFFSFSLTSHFVIFFFLLSAIVKTESTEKNTEKFNPLTLLIIPIVFYFSIFKVAQAENTFSYALHVQTYDYDKSIELIEDTIESNPYYAYYRYKLLIRDESIIPEQSTEIRKIEGETMDNLGWEAVSISKSDLSKSITLFEKIIEKNPEYPAGNRIFGDAYYRNGKYAEAIPHYEKFLDLAPQFWRWCPEINEKTEWERWQYRIFHKNTFDFTTQQDI
ncbi:O-antigen ligase family protein [Candidatus Gracilibacteria bacterium]|nr:O-antigen ligase family protein [Candidatus Gracilibacteria bacterium]